MCFGSFFDLSKRPQKVKSEVAPYCKLTFAMKTNYVPSFILLSKSAQKKGLATVAANLSKSMYLSQMVMQ